MRRAALPAALAVLLPALAAASGAVLLPVRLETLAQRATAVVLGRTAGTRVVQVRVPVRPGTPLAARGRTHLAFQVRQYGVTVERVLSAGGGTPIAQGDVLWLTDPAGYDQGAMGPVAGAAWVSRERYQPRRPLDPEQRGRALIAFAESSRDRAARGRGVAGLEDGWWLPAANAFEAPARRAEVERLRLLAPAVRDGPATSPGSPPR